MEFQFPQQDDVVSLLKTVKLNGIITILINSTHFLCGVCRQNLLFLLQFLIESVQVNF